MKFLRMMFGKSDNFAGRPYAWLTNQLSHVWLGSIFVLIISMVCFYGYGEYPVKEYALGLIAAAYIGFEIKVQGWQGWDTVEDSVFVCVYGAAGVLLIFTEVAPGSPALKFDPSAAAMVMLAFAFNVVIGIATRAGSVK